MFGLWLIMSIICTVPIFIVLSIIGALLGLPSSDDAMMATLVISVIISMIFNTKLLFTFDDNLKKELVDIDKQEPIQDYIKMREILNSINFQTATKSQLINALEKIANGDCPLQLESLKQENFQAIKEGMIEMRDRLNSMNLESMNSISSRELLKDSLTDEQLEKAQDDINNKLINNNNPTAEASPEYYDESSDSRDIGSEILAALSGGSKQDRIKRKRKELEKLEREHKFQRGFIPYWDSEERLYDNERDEEKYLDAKILELKEKNLSHDMYLTEEEKRIYDDDTDGGMW